MTTHLPGDDLDLQGVVKLHVRIIHHYIDIDNSIHLVGGDKNGFIDAFHAMVQELPASTILHRRPALSLPDVILERGGGKREEGEGRGGGGEGRERGGERRGGEGERGGGGKGEGRREEGEGRREEGEVEGRRKEGRGRGRREEGRGRGRREEGEGEEEG